MKRLTKIVRLRISDEEFEMMLGKNIREALIEKLQKEFPENFKVPF